MLETFEDDPSPLPQGELHLRMQYSTDPSHPEATATITCVGVNSSSAIFSENATRFVRGRVPPIIVEQPDTNTLIIKGSRLNLNQPVLEGRELTHFNYDLYQSSLNIINAVQKEASLHRFSIPYTYQGQKGHLDVTVEMRTQHRDMDKGSIFVTTNIQQTKEWRKAKTVINGLPIPEYLPEAEIKAQQHAAIAVASQLFSQFKPNFTGKNGDKYHLAHFDIWNGGGQKYIDIRPTSSGIGLQKLYVDVKDYLTQLQKAGIVVGGHAEKVRRQNEEPLGQQIADVLYQFKDTLNKSTRIAIRQALERKLGSKGFESP